MIGRASRGNPLDFPGDEPLFFCWRGNGKAHSKGSAGHDPSACQGADPSEGGIYGNPGNAQACGLVYRRNAHSAALRRDSNLISSYEELEKMLRSFA